MAIVMWLAVCHGGMAVLAVAQPSQPPGGSVTREIGVKALESTQATPPAKAPITASPPPPPQLAGETGPELYLLRDKEGKLQAVPGFSFEDFMELYRLKKRLTGGDERPRYIVSQCMMTGAVRDKVAALSVVLTIELNDPNWARIPLGLTHAFAEGTAKLEGTGEVALEFTAPPAVERNRQTPVDGDGYVLWIKGEPKKPQKVTIPIVVPLVTVGEETLLRLESPRATAAQLVVAVPMAGAVARVSDGATLLEPVAAPNRTTFSVVGANGLVELAWRPAGSAPAATPAVLEASGSTIAKIDGQSVGFESRLNVRSFGGQFDRFRLRLPPGATLVGSSPAGLNVSAVTSDDSAKEPHNMIEVRLEKKTAGPVEVRLIANRPRAAENTEESLELAGFELIGAVRQWGTLGVQVVGNWQIVWTGNSGVRQVDDVAGEFKSEDLVGTFEYSMQPYSLTARIMPRRTRMSVQPKYAITTGAAEARLTADFKYTIRGAKVRILTLAMPGWEIDEIGPPTLVNVDAAAIEDPSRFSIPLVQPANGDLTLSITARRRMPLFKGNDIAKSIQFELPRPEAEVVAPALLVVQPEDNVQLSPTSDKLTGLSLRPTRHVGAAPNLQQDPLVYQVEGEGARFVADFQVNAQVVKAEMQATMQVDERAVAVEQHLQYSILHEPLDKLILSVPRSLTLSEVSFSLDNTILRPIASEPTAAAPADAERTSISLPLGTSRIGACELICRFSVPLDTLPAATSIPSSVGLILPVGATVGKSSALVRSAAGVVVSLRKGAWALEETADNRQVADAGLRIRTSEPAESIALAVMQQDRSQLPTTLIERGLIQSRIVPSGRQDYVALRVLTGERRLQLELPEGLSAKDVQVSINGVPAGLDSDNGGRYFIALPEVNENDRLLLELSYQISDRAGAGWRELEVPRLVPAAWDRQLYWQLVVPGHEHLLASSGNYSTEMKWQWNGWYWRRVAVQDGAALARWLGVSPDRLNVPSSANCYLFDTIGAFQPLTVYTARRATLVFGSSLLVLLVGLGLLYRRAMRSVGLLLAAAVGLLALGLLAPDVAVLVGQSAILGAALIAVALLLSRYSTAEAVQPSPSPVHRELIESGFDRGTELFEQSGLEMPKSTATAPSMLPVTSAEGTP